MWNIDWNPPWSQEIMAFHGFFHGFSISVSMSTPGIPGIKSWWSPHHPVLWSGWGTLAVAKAPSTRCLLKPPGFSSSDFWWLYHLTRILLDMQTIWTHLYIYTHYIYNHIFNHIHICSYICIYITKSVYMYM